MLPHIGVVNACSWLVVWMVGEACVLWTLKAPVGGAGRFEGGRFVIVRHFDVLLFRRPLEGDCGWECDEFGVGLGKVKMV